MYVQCALKGVGPGRCAGRSHRRTIVLFEGTTSRAPRDVGAMDLSIAFPTAGMLSSNMLYLSPLPAVFRVLEEKDIGDLNPTPLALMLVSATSWFGFGLMIKDGFVVAANGTGVVLSVWYLAVVLPFMAKEPALGALRKILVTGAAFIISSWTATSFFVAEDYAEEFMGAWANVAAIALYGSPLSTIAVVCRTQSAASILGTLTVIQVINCFTWTVYGVIINNIWVWGPSAVGLALGLAQLALKIIFPSTLGGLARRRNTGDARMEVCRCQLAPRSMPASHAPSPPRPFVQRSCKSWSRRTRTGGTDVEW